MKNLITIMIILFMPIFIYGQEYVDFTSQDDVKFEYKWRKKNLLKKDSPYVLYLKITNKGFERKLVSFELFYFWNGFTHSRSGYKEYCIKPGKKICGKRWDLAFKSEIKTLEEIHDRRFSWEIEKIKIEESEFCKSGFRLKLEPAHNMYLTE
ncbi:MAG: hypothetical protein A2041_05430 [Bacteroidetes bacterium GWA2_31_9b]|nr:MAG: hypothetical protein A2041_05430 [Bacteroidetes bacterium GWA2_31_9b]